jgi:hypothetical protein
MEREMNKQNVFDEFKASFEKQNLILKISMLLIVGLLTACLFMINANKTLFLKINSEYLTKEMPMKDICFFSIKTIVDKKLSTSFITGQIKEYFKENRRVAINASKIYDPIVLSENKCKVIINDHDKLKAFVLTLEKNASNPFLFKTVDINEVVIDEKEVK